MKKLTALFSYVLLAGASHGALANHVGSEQQPINDISVQDVVFPDPSSTYLKDIPRIDANNLLLLSTGISKDNVRRVLGNPHFNEFNAKKWNYLLHVRQPHGQDDLHCQLQITFDSSKMLEAIYWRTPECAALVHSLLQPPMPAPLPMVPVADAVMIVPLAETPPQLFEVLPEPEPKPVIAKQAVEEAPEAQVFVLSSDILFDFNSSQLTMQSGQEIQQLMTQIRDGYQSVSEIHVVGHTDRLGDNAYNRKLSLDRATMIKNSLMRYGVNPLVIHVDSKGATMPITDGCYHMNAADTKACLSPDRRVEVRVIGEPKGGFGTNGAGQ